MEIKLMKIKQTNFDDVIDIVYDNYQKTGKVDISPDVLNDNSERLYLDTNEIICDINVSNYLKIVDNDDFSYVKLAKVGMRLHKDLKMQNGNSIPRNILYQKELWAYLSLSVFKDVVSKLRKLDSDDSDDKLKRIYFNCGTISRTCLLFAWCMIDRLESEDDLDLSLTAFEFIDPVKAIFERTLSRSPLILKAFVQGIINNKKDPLFKKVPYKTTIPNNISCYAAVNMLECLDYDLMLNVITEQQKALLN